MFGIFGGAQELTGATSDAGTHGRLDTTNSLVGTLDNDLNAGLGTDGVGETPANGTGVRGWLRSIYDKLNSGVSVTVTNPTSSTVTVSNFPATQPVSNASLPLPTGASTSSNQTNGTQQTKVTDGTNTANLVTGDSGSTAQVVLPPTRTVGVVGISTNSTAVDAAGYRELVFQATAATGTGATIWGIQESIDGSTNWTDVAGATFSRDGTAGYSSSGATFTSAGPFPLTVTAKIQFRYIRIALESGSGTLTGKFLLHAVPQGWWSQGQAVNAPGGAALATSLNQTNGTQQSKITDGSTAADVITGDSKGLVVQLTSKTTSIITAGASDTVIDLAGYGWGTLHISSTGTTISATVQASDTNSGSDWVTIPTASLGNSGAFSTNPLVSVGLYGFSRYGRYIRIHITSQTGVAPLLTVTGFAGTPPWNAQGQSITGNIGQSGIWTVQPGNTQNTTPWLVFEGGWTFKHLNANTVGTSVKGTAGVLHSVTINNAGTTDTITLYDGTSTAGTVIAVIGSSAETVLIYDCAFATGLFVAIAGTTAPDITINYR